MRSTAREITLLSLGALLSCSGHPAEVHLDSIESVTPTKNILLISVDTLRADHLGLYGYSRQTSPLLDAWFEDGAIYERAYTTEANTAPAMMSCLTGLLPYQHGVRLLYQLADPSIAVVSDYLGAAGYQTAAVVSNIVLTQEAIGLNTRFDHYDDFVDEGEDYGATFERRAARTTNSAIQWLATQREPDRSSFLWVHYIDPHGPYGAPEDRPIDFEHDQPIEIDDDRVPPYSRLPGVQDGAEYIDRYDEEIAYTDQEVDRLLKTYDDLGMLENSLVIFTADHGESMMEHESWFTHGYHVYEEITHIPLMMRGRAVSGGRISVPVSLADVAPTIIESAGMQPPGDSYGESLFHPAEGRTIFAEATDSSGSRRAVWRGSEKWILAVPPPNKLAGRVARVFGLIGVPTPLWNQGISLDGAVYHNLDTDPDELGPVSASQEADPLRDLLTVLDDDPFPGGVIVKSDSGRQIDAPKVAAGVDDEALEKLRSLGYVQ